MDRRTLGGHFHHGRDPGPGSGRCWGGAWWVWLRGCDTGNCGRQRGESYETYCAKVDAVLDGMPDKTAKLVRAYPPAMYGNAGTTISLLYKSDANYAVLSISAVQTCGCVDGECSSNGIPHRRVQQCGCRLSGSIRPCSWASSTAPLSGTTANLFCDGRERRGVPGQLVKDD